MQMLQSKTAVVQKEKEKQNRRRFTEPSAQNDVEGTLQVQYTPIQVLSEPSLQ